MDHLKKLSTASSPEPLAEYKPLRKQHEKVGFALKLKLDPAACFCTLQEQTAASSSNTESSSTGWMSLWEIAAMEGLKFEEDAPNKLLMAVVAGLQERPHEKRELAAAGQKQWYFFQETCFEEQRIPKA